MMLPLFVVVPLAAAFLIALSRGRVKNLSDILANVSSAFLLGLSLFTIRPVVTDGAFIYKMGGWPPPVGICLVADGLAVFMLVIVNLIAFLSMVYSVSYMDSYTGKWKFHALFMLMLAGMCGVIISGDLFNLYIFLEMASISGYILVAFGAEAQDFEAAFRYAIMGAVASIFILLGIAFLYSYTSTLNMADMSLVLAMKEQGALIVFVSVLFLAGFGLKSALVPFHAWLPDAHSSAPTPISAVLSGVFIKTLGIYALCRVFFNVLGASERVLFMLICLGVLSMVVGAFLAIAQNDIKRMFAYSSISQVGYVVFALGIGTPLAVFAGLFHLLNHAVFKPLLFFNAGAIEYTTGERRINKLGGLGSRLPVTASAGLMGSMAISGVPPLAGFWSKLLIILAAVQSRYFGFAATAALVSVITLAYYLKFQSSVFYGKLPQGLASVKEAPLTMKIAMTVLAALCIIGGIMLLPPFNSFIQSAADVLLSGGGYKEAVFNAAKI